ncbi:MAG: hypothetical protein PUF65_05490 [Lachnospiraceae bacterium]|nr:hypothetical protein [Lachnospiraceae bacterium]
MLTDGRKFRIICQTADRRPQTADSRQRKSVCFLYRNCRSHSGGMEEEKSLHAASSGFLRALRWKE